MKKALLFLLITLFLSVAQAYCAATSDQYLTAGNTLYQQQNYSRAILYYKAAIQVDPNNAAAHTRLANTYYMLGQKSDALTQYQAALSLNPNNSQLAAFVQKLQAQLGAAPPTSEPAAYKPSFSPVKTFEIAPMIGLGIGSSLSIPATLSAPATTINYGMGVGGGVEGYYFFDPNFAIGVDLEYYTFTDSQSVTFSYTQSGQTVAGTATVSDTISSIGFIPTVKYEFSGTSIRPYFTLGVGLSSLTIGSTTTYNYTSGGSNSSSSSPTAPNNTQMEIMAKLGAGVEFPLGPGMNLFAQARYAMIMISASQTQESATFSYIPVEAGLNFDF